MPSRSTQFTQRENPTLQNFKCYTGEVYKEYYRYEKEYLLGTVGYTARESWFSGSRYKNEDPESEAGTGQENKKHFIHHYSYQPKGGRKSNN